MTTEKRTTPGVRTGGRQCDLLAGETDLDSSPPEIREGLIRCHLTAMFEAAPDDHYMVLTSAPIGPVDWVKGDPEYGTAGAPASHRCVPVRDVDQAVERIMRAGPTRNIYVSACTLLEDQGTQRRAREDIAAGLVGFWADVDVDGPGHKATSSGLPHPPTNFDALDLIDDCPLPATTVLATGGGFHAWWMFDRFVEITEANRAQWMAFSRAWHAGLGQAGKNYGWHVDQVGDLARVMRVAGTIRTKCADPAPHLVTIHEASSGHRFQPDHVVRATIPEDPPEPPPEPPRSSLTASRRPLVSSGDPDRFGPANAFDDVSWEDILRPHDWEYVGDSKGVGLWRRPGASSAYSIKVTDAAAVNWSSALPGWPTGKLAPGSKLTKWRVWCLVNGFGYGQAAESAAATYIREQQNARRKGVRR